MLQYSYMRRQETTGEQRGNFLLRARPSAALLASAALLLCNASSTKAAQNKPKPQPDKPVFVAGKGMTKPFIAEIRHGASNSFLPVPKGRFVVTLGNTGIVCADAKKKNRPNIAACIDTEKNIAHFNKNIRPWQIARYTAHEMGHKGIDEIWRKEKKMQPRRASKFLVGLFMISGIADNPAEARNIIRQGPLTQKMSPDMRAIYADEAAAEMVGSCAQAGFVLHEGTDFESWLSNDAKVTVPAQQYNATCHYIYNEFSKRPGIFTPAGAVAPEEPMGINYYDNMFCSIKTGNNAWPQWQRACRDSAGASAITASVNPVSSGQYFHTTPLASQR